MKSSHKQNFSNEKLQEQGKEIARGMNELKVEREKGMAKAVKRRATMLEHAAEKELFG